MAGWGDLLSTAISSYSPTAGALVNFGSSILDKIDTDKKNKTATSAYYSALANQQQMSTLAAQTAAQRAAFETALKNRALATTGDLGTSMRAAQTAMGGMPQFDQGKIDRDYQTTKATMTNDFNDMLKLVDSQGRAAQMERLGGADSYQASTDRMSALMKRYAPELQKIDDAAYDSAVSRATNTQNLISKSRGDTLKEIQGVYDAELDPQLKLLQGNDVSALINSTSNGAKTAADVMKDSEGSQGATDTIANDSLKAILKAFNR